MHLSSLFLYPVKSCRRMQLRSAVVTHEGFAFDRQWVVVDASGKFITQRQQPKMALVETHIQDEVLALGTSGASLPGAALTLTAPGMPALTVPLQLPSPLSISRIQVWSWEGAAADEGPEAAQWLSTYLGQEARLMRHVGHAAGAGAAEPGSAEAAAAAAIAAAAQAAGQEPGSVDRPANPEFVTGWNVHFQDQFPLLITSEASLAALAAAVGEQPSIPMTRFRPNIVIAGADQPWSEDTWHKLAVHVQHGQAGSTGPDGTLEVVLAKPCMRCKIVRTDQETAQLTDEPSETLSKIRNGGDLGWASWHKTFKMAHFFGWGAVPLIAPGVSGLVLSVGDQVQVAAPREPLPPGAAMQPFVNTLAAVGA